MKKKLYAFLAVVLVASGIFAVVPKVVHASDVPPDPAAVYTITN